MIMASKITKFYCLILLVVVMVVMELASGCQTGHRCIYPKAITSPDLDIQSRKMLPGPTSNSVNGKKLVAGDELRTVPSGPDPLHHNGATPKKPRTP